MIVLTKQLGEMTLSIQTIVLEGLVWAREEILILRQIDSVVT